MSIQFWRMSIQLNGINCYYGAHQALFDITLDCPAGETLVLLGPSGAGKSSLLRVLNLLEMPRSGQLQIAGNQFDFKQAPGEKAIRELRQNVGMVFQQYNLWPHLTVVQNLIEAPCRVLGLTKAQAMERADKLLKRLRLTDFADRFPLHLSGGQQQRVAIARAIAVRPKVLLLDEPLSALDARIRKHLREQIRRIQRELNLTAIFVTHDQEEAMTMAGRIAIMNRGKFVQIGEPEEIYEHPNSRFSAEFIGSVNVFDCVLQERHDDALILQSPGLRHAIKVDPDASVVDGVPIQVALRPEKILLCEQVPEDGCNFAVGEVAHISYLGDLSIYHVKLHSGQIISAQLQNGHRFRKGMPTWGDEVRLCWETDSCVVLTV